MSLGRKLDNDGSFHQQKKFVQSLRTISKDDLLNRTIDQIEEKQTPFEVDATSIPDHLEVKVFHHAVTDEGDVDSDAEEENDTKSSSAVVSRQLKISQQQKTEKMVMHFPDEANNTSQTIKIKFKADGSVAVHKKNVPLSALQRDLLFADGRKQAGIVIEAHDTKDNQTRYSAYTKP